MNVLDFLNPVKGAASVAKEVVDVLQATGVIGPSESQRADIFAKVQEVIQKDREQFVEIYKTESANMESARNMQTSLLQDAPKWIKAISALVVPFGGIGALSVFFFNILAANIGFERVSLTLEESLTLDGIIGFFFVYRFKQKQLGIAGKF